MLPSSEQLLSASCYLLIGPHSTYTPSSTPAASVTLGTTLFICAVYTVYGIFMYSTNWIIKRLIDKKSRVTVIFAYFASAVGSASICLITVLYFYGFKSLMYFGLPISLLTTLIFMQVGFQSHLHSPHFRYLIFCSAYLLSPFIALIPLQLFPQVIFSQCDETSLTQMAVDILIFCLSFTLFVNQFGSFLRVFTARKVFIWGGQGRKCGYLVEKNGQWVKYRIDMFTGIEEPEEVEEEEFHSEQLLVEP